MVGIVWGAKNYQTVINWLTENAVPNRLIKTASDTEGVDVAIFCGGPDIGINAERDTFEKEIFQICIQQHIAVLGICRGMQMVCHLLGAPLITDLAEKNSRHQAVEKAYNRPSSWHAIQLSNGMRWHVNSRHHQAVKESPFKCQLAGKSDDGVLELLQSADNRFLVVQSHPEMEEMRQSEIADLCIQWMKNRMGIALLKHLYSINSKSGNEQALKKFIVNRISSLPITIHQDAFGNMYLVKGETDTYPCLAAHLDEVHLPSHRYIQETNGRLWAIGDEQYPIGTGADDKNGIWVAIQILETTTIPIKVLLTVQEEKDGEMSGCRGANHCELSWFDNVKYIIECDRRGKSDLVTTGKRKDTLIRLCDDDWIPLRIQEEYHYSPITGGSTDVVTLKSKGLTIPVCNLSCGYYNAHNDGEYTIYSELVNCLHFVMKIIHTL